jgi:hypothetical protein
MPGIFIIRAHQQQDEAVIDIIVAAPDLVEAQEAGESHKSVYAPRYSDFLYTSLKCVKKIAFSFYTFLTCKDFRSLFIPLMLARCPILSWMRPSVAVSRARMSRTISAGGRNLSKTLVKATS